MNTYTKTVITILSIVLMLALFYNVSYGNTDTLPGPTPTVTMTRTLFPHEMTSEAVLTWVAQGAFTNTPTPTATKTLSIQPFPTRTSTATPTLIPTFVSTMGPTVTPTKTFPAPTDLPTLTKTPIGPPVTTEPTITPTHVTPTPLPVGPIRSFLPQIIR